MHVNTITETKKRVYGKTKEEVTVRNPLQLKCQMSLGVSSIVLLLLQFSSRSWLKCFWAPPLSLYFLLIMDHLTIHWAGDGCGGVIKPWRGDSTAWYLTQFCEEWRSVVCSQSDWKGHQGLVTHCRAQQCPRPRPILSRLSGKQSHSDPTKGHEFFLSWNSRSSAELGCVHYPTTSQRVKVLQFYGLPNFQYDVIFSIFIGTYHII